MRTTGHGSVNVIPDLEYVARSSGLLHLDLALPHGPARQHRKTPLILYLHGGAWVMGSRHDHPQRIALLAEQGFAVASLDYRLAHQAPFPAQREDVAAAIDFLRRNQELWGVDMSAVGLYGASAGAHLAAMAALSMSESSDAGVFGLAGIFGRYDLTARGLVPGPGEGLRPPEEIINSSWPAEIGGRPVPPMGLRALLAGVKEDRLDEATLRAISPIHLLDSASFPILVMHGSADGVTHPAHGRNFVAAARAAGQQAEFRLIEGANHEDPWFDTSESAALVADFFRAALGSHPRADIAPTASDHMTGPRR